MTDEQDEQYMRDEAEKRIFAPDYKTVIDHVHVSWNDQKKEIYVTGYRDTKIVGDTSDAN